MASSKTLNDKKHSKKSGETTSRSKDKERKSKNKDRVSSSKDDKNEINTTTDDVVVSTLASASVGHDPDAIQLFRRYDRNRSGALTRFDFLQLLKDYADSSSSTPVTTPSRPPLSLTDTNGIPLGYQRADRNSEFEAGQLFERYDRDHAGALTLDAFHAFFADFKPQLRAFVEESNYRPFAPPVTTISSRQLEPVQEDECLPASENVQDAANDRNAHISPKEVKSKYRSALWKLRNLCKNELIDQRERLVQHMKSIRIEISHRQQHRSSRRTHRRSRTVPVQAFNEEDIGFGNEREVEETKQFEAMEDDLDRLDDVIGFVRFHLNKGSDVSQQEMQKFLDQADRIEEEAECLAMKDYGDVLKSESIENVMSPHVSPKTPPTASIQPESSRDQKLLSLESLLRVKDQMIYQLLQERTAMRKKQNAVEASLKKLSDVSTREMKKWARLTDDMQTEIQQLQSQLQSQ
ncbi:EF-hand domain pair [Plasmopara halstedii]|uniref:EF-hand domain pair n=1 Tax=Plasmopara halstedii TaxID=4781 RepID=A0A0P1AWR5_PLAHL|nr:EF-hand domain pair [Plasmopara halstedii]CEG46870.1 EF-hand domain pair [Plasmopara halstedii]|eukprot:XP_024583239.1 EF-hand domain pair [Plasmopara halstedii]